MFFGNSRYSQKILAFIIFITLACFAWYLTLADLDEKKAKFSNKRILLVKLLAREVVGLLNNHQNVTPRLENFVAQESVAYSIIQQPDGIVVARAESGSMPFSSFSEAETRALKASNIESFKINDTSGTFSILEIVVPLVNNRSSRYVLRTGFFTDAEECGNRKIIFRNSLIFCVFIFLIMAYWQVRRNKVSNIHHLLLGGTALIILLLFLASRMTLQGWYERNWRKSFVRHGLYVSKLVLPTAIDFIKTNKTDGLKQLFKLLSEDENFSSIAVIKDDTCIFHSDPSFINTSMKDDKNYIESLNSEQPRVFNTTQEGYYEAMIPIMNGRHRLGTVKTGFRVMDGYTPLVIIKNRLVYLFAAALIIILYLMNLLSKRITKEISWFISAMENVTSGDLSQAIYIERDDEFGQLAHSFNFMIMSLKEKELINKGLQHYVSKSIVDRTLKILSSSGETGEKLFAISIFIYFSGLDEAIEKIEGKAIFSAAKDIYSKAQKIYPPGDDVSFQVLPSGILIMCSNRDKHQSLLKALNISKILATDIGRKSSLPFSPKITLHAADMILAQVADEKSSNHLLGDGFIDFRAVATVQASDEVIVSRQIYTLMKDVLNFEELEILSSEQGRFSVFVVKEFRPKSELETVFQGANSWTKIIILRILKLARENIEFETVQKWFQDEDSEVRFHVLDMLERCEKDQACKFVEKVLKSEKKPKIVSKALRVLGKIGNESHIELIAEKLRSDDRRIKANAVEALEAIGGKKVYEFLNLLVYEKDNRVKANILIALGKYGDLKVFELLSKMMLDNDSNMRASAAYALGKLGMAQGVEPLINAINDTDPVVRKQVANSLSILKSELDVN